MGETQSGFSRVVVMGAGAVGCYFGARLAEAGVPVTLIGRQAHVDAIRARGLRFESGGERRHIAIDASTTTESLREAGLVLLCVKSPDTEACARTIARLAPPDAIVVSMQNGVDNVERAAAGGVDALAAVVYVAVSMAGPGHVVHAGRGDLVLGEFGNGARGARAPGRAARVAAMFESAGVPCPVVADARTALWTKLVMNCVFNAVSALARARYGLIVEDPLARDLTRAVVDECVAVARADGVELPPAAELHEAAMTLGQRMAGATSSTEQDLARGRKTEIDSLNGYVVSRSKALGVAAPVNGALHALVRLLEASL